MRSYSSSPIGVNSYNSVNQNQAQRVILPSPPPNMMNGFQPLSPQHQTQISYSSYNQPQVLNRPINHNMYQTMPLSANHLQQNLVPFNQSYSQVVQNSSGK